MKKQTFLVMPFDDDSEVYLYEGNENEAREKFETEVEATDDPPIESNFNVWCLNNLTLIKSFIRPSDPEGR
jgi:hypothetical protein